MKRLKIVAIIATSLLIVAMMIFSVSSDVAENAGHKAIRDNGGSMGTIFVERIVENTKESIDRVAYIFTVLGIGGIFIVTSKWIEREKTSDAKDKYEESDIGG